MQGVRAFEPKANANIDLESFVAEDFLRRIDRVLDLSFLRELTAGRYADGQGRPSIDPEVSFSMQLVAYFYGITTDRRLYEEVRYNLAYRWFCRLSLSGVQLVDSHILFQGQDQPFALGHFVPAHAFDGYCTCQADPSERITGGPTAQLFDPSLAN